MQRGELLGYIYHDRAYWSTSLELETGRKFAQDAHNMKGAGFLVRVLVKAGTNAIWMERISEFGEFEILLPCGLHFRIVQVLPPGPPLPGQTASQPVLVPELHVEIVRELITETAMSERHDRNDDKKSAKHKSENPVYSMTPEEIERNR